MLNKKKIIQVAIVVGLAAFYAINDRIGNQAGNNSGNNGGNNAGIQWDKWGSGSAGSNNSLLLGAIANRRSDVQVEGSGEVIKVLPDDTRGSQHQRFLLRVSDNNVILIAHNIDLAPRINALQKGDSVGFNGEFEWNDKGGVVHWTHKDPRGKHIHGWLQHDGKKYW